MTQESTAAPPILQFTLRALDAPGLSELATVCVEDMVALLGCRRAVVRDEERVWAACSSAEGDEPSSVSLAFRLSGPAEPKVVLEISVEPGPDLQVVRQQFLDLMAIARRAWRDRRLLSEERQRARQDALTGLENRLSIDEYLEHALRHGRITGEPITVMLVDLDGFKDVNDTYGHLVGDEVLQFAATCLQEHLRPTDRVCRMGGDEFLVACPGLAVGAAAGVAERLRAAFREHPRARGATMSVGIADTGALDSANFTTAALLRLADARLYAAKQSGRDRHCTEVLPKPRAVGSG